MLSEACSIQLLHVSPLNFSLSPSAVPLGWDSFLHTVGSYMYWCYLASAAASLPLYLTFFCANLPVYSVWIFQKIWSWHTDYFVICFFHYGMHHECCMENVRQSFHAVDLKWGDLCSLSPQSFMLVRDLFLQNLTNPICSYTHTHTHTHLNIYYST